VINQGAITLLEALALQVALGPTLHPTLDLTGLGVTLKEGYEPLETRAWAPGVVAALDWLRTQPVGPKGKGHRAEKHTHCQSDHCMVCDGGLFICVDCYAFEGATTTECPGVRCYNEMSDFVYQGLIDFKNGEWIVGPGQMPCWVGAIRYDEDVVIDRAPKSCSTTTL
jgi:hypothetical protein